MAQTENGGRTLGLRNEAAKQLYDYWNALRNGGAAPGRSDVDPAVLRRYLSNTFVLEFTGDVHVVFRIAGTTLCAAFGRELRDHNLAGLWDDPGRRELQDATRRLRRDAFGVIARFKGVTLDKSPHPGEMLILPLRDEAGAITRGIGHFHLNRGIESLAHGHLVRLTGGSVDIFDPRIDALGFGGGDDRPPPAPRVLTVVETTDSRPAAVTGDGHSTLWARKLAPFFEIGEE